MAHLIYVSLFSLLTTAYAENLCLENRAGVQWIGDSRMDRGSASSYRDIDFPLKDEVSATWGSGLLVQMFQRYPNSYYETKRQKRVLYVGVNDCFNIDTPLALPKSLTQGQFMSEVYRQYLTGSVNVQQTGWSLISGSIDPHGIGNWPGGRARFIIASGATIEVGPVGQNLQGDSHRFFSICTKGSGQIETVAIGTSFQCGVYKTAVTITGLTGFLWIGPLLVTKPGDARSVLLRSNANKPICSELAAIWGLPPFNGFVHAETPVVAGFYPGGGPDTMHGSPVVRDFFNAAVTGNCSNVDWDEMEYPACGGSTGIECVYKALPTTPPPKTTTTKGTTTTKTTAPHSTMYVGPQALRREELGGSNIFEVLGMVAFIALAILPCILACKCIRRSREEGARIAFKEVLGLKSV